MIENDDDDKKNLRFNEHPNYQQRHQRSTNGKLLEQREKTSIDTKLSNQQFKQALLTS
jgi:hypothetical protein